MRSFHLASAGLDEDQDGLDQVGDPAREQRSLRRTRQALSWALARSPRSRRLLVAGGRAAATSSAARRGHDRILRRLRQFFSSALTRSPGPRQR
ncbi:MAG: hypothetical protein JWP64_227, partial [Pseudonocardia sp.]|nr:hypothetical protein [Pseudonocardia sp.]